MALLERVRVALTGFPGGPGVNTFYFLDTATALTSLKNMYLSLAGYLPSDVHVQVQNTGDIIESTTGAITGAWQSPPVPEVIGTFTGVYAAPVGFMAGWETSTILDGRRLRGRTFFVPAASNIFNTLGSIGEGYLVGIRSTVADFQVSQSSSLVIWHRPFAGSPAVGTRKARPAHSGGVGLVTATRVPAKAVVLRTRRD